MSRLKTLAEIVDQPFLTKADIRKILRCGSEKAREVFELAEQIDVSELAYRVFDYKVRTASVCRVIGIPHEELKKSVLQYAPSDK